MACKVDWGAVMVAGGKLSVFKDTHGNWWRVESLTAVNIFAIWEQALKLEMATPQMQWYLVYTQKINKAEWMPENAAPFLEK